MVAQRSAARPVCPLCKTLVQDRGEHERLKRSLEEQILQKHSELTKKERTRYAGAVHALKISHIREMRDLRAQHMNQEQMLKKSLNERMKQDKVVLRKRLVDLRRNYQVQIRNLRELYDMENLRVQKEQEGAFNNQLKDIIQNYASLASNHQKELDRLKKSQVASSVSLRKKDHEIARLKIEIAKSSSELQVKELMLQINERNMVIEQLHDKIRELEARVGSARHTESAGEIKASQKIAQEDEQKQKLKEYMKAIIEITKNQQLSDKKRAETDQNASDKIKQDLGGSKTDKLRGFFL